MTEKPLTAKQEAFAQAVASGLNQSDAYRKAYNAEKMSDKQVWEEASKLFSNPKVAPRVAELKAKLNARLEAKALWSREEAAEVLRKAISLGLDSDSHGKLADAVKSVEVLNKMTGLDAPLKLEHSGGVGVQVVAVADMSAVLGEGAEDE